MVAVETRGRQLRKLLFAADGSAASRAAGLVVARLAMGGLTEVVVLNVDECGQLEHARALAGRVCCALAVVAVDARAEVRQSGRGRLADAIAASAREEEADLVVLGSRGRSDLGGLLLGSVAQQVLERAGCAVLVVRSGRRTSSRRGRVLVAMAGDEDLERLVRTAAAVAEPDSAVLVMHLLAPGDGDPELAASSLLVQRTVERLRRYGVRARCRAPATPDETARTAMKYGADVVVMGSRQLPALTSLLRGPLPEGVHRPRPVEANSPVQAAFAKQNS